MASRRLIDDFLGQKRLAMVGLSRKQSDFSRFLFRELTRRGYDVVPVNPQAEEIEGRRCAASLDAVNPAVDTALLMTAPAVTDQVVRDCAAAGIKRVWIYRTSPGAVAFCDANGIAVVASECPLMFLPRTGWIHRVHGWCKKTVGSYPS